MFASHGIKVLQSTQITGSKMRIIVSAFWLLSLVPCPALGWKNKIDFEKDFVCQIQNKPTVYVFQNATSNHAVNQGFLLTFISKFVSREDSTPLQKTGLEQSLNDGFNMSCFWNHLGFQCRTTVRDMMILRPIFLHIPRESFLESETSERPNFKVKAKGLFWYRMDYGSWKAKPHDEPLETECHFQLKEALVPVFSGRLT